MSGHTVHASPVLAVAAPPRAIVHRTRGRRHGPLVRLVSPGDLGAVIAPFVFLDHFDVVGGAAPGFGMHPHSGIATLTLLLDGGFSYEDSTGASGSMQAGGVEWMQAGGGVWHGGDGSGERIHGFQLWIALPPAHENGPASSRYLGQAEVPRSGPARVILGALDGVRSAIEAPSPIDYLDVRLQAGQTWRYQPPPGHSVAWLAVHEGRLAVPGPLEAGALAVFAKGEGAIAFQAETATSFVLGSAAPHPHELVLGSYSVHTDRQALARGETRIREIGAELRRSGKL